MAAEWIQEFANEILCDARALRDARGQRADSPWSYDGALARTQEFYRQRIAGFCVCGSVDERQRDHLLGLVEAMGA